MVSRYYCLRFKDGKIATIKADINCKPGPSNKFYRPKLNGAVVAEFPEKEVVGWWIEEPPQWSDDPFPPALK